ncbi:redox-sensing transcriptional repressor Rex [Fimbriiglobus ruber]|uniref:Redox-sensing transcriptional repressor Rex n=1 Tax=Fimbriiglobus ruber TaxID=1908690 RepID=A0A225E6K6_9BACT|nr:redox-sensing transcriptional repressor Rex [Fimbriiglobus ruber]OWK44295.1 Redox-sensitive transcriptional regulator (AT-rich DNA-binding protein) [Fimbriiglobus ruber]
MSDERQSDPDSRLSRATAQRLSQYLRCLGSSGTRGSGPISSEELALAVGVSAAQVRRDLAALGHLGQRGVGYDTPALETAIRKTLGIDREWRAVLVGVGNLARALLRYRGFRDQGFVIVGLFDSDPHKVGQPVEGLTVEPVSAIPTRVSTARVELGILTVPSEPAQSVADALVAAGVKGLLNFAPVLLRTPPAVRVVTVDLAIQLEQLAFLVQLRDPPSAEKLVPEWVEKSPPTR